MIRRPLWFGAGMAAGVAGTVWAHRRVRRQLRRAVDAISPSAAGQVAKRTAREATARVQVAVEAARSERQRREAELWYRLGEVPPGSSAVPPVGLAGGSSPARSPRGSTGMAMRTSATRRSFPRAPRQHR